MPTLCSRTVHPSWLCRRASACPRPLQAPNTCSTVARPLHSCRRISPCRPTWRMQRECSAAARRSLLCPRASRCRRGSRKRMRSSRGACRSYGCPNLWTCQPGWRGQAACSPPAAPQSRASRPTTLAPTKRCWTTIGPPTGARWWLRWPTATCSRLRTRCPATTVRGSRARRPSQTATASPPTWRCRTIRKAMRSPAGAKAPTAWCRSTSASPSTRPRPSTANGLSRAARAPSKGTCAWSMPVPPGGASLPTGNFTSIARAGRRLPISAGFRGAPASARTPSFRGRCLGTVQKPCHQGCDGAGG
jgi:Listeria-Bacteroides repeat domain (List_Bact_rpt).